MLPDPAVLFHGLEVSATTAEAARSRFQLLITDLVSMRHPTANTVAGPGGGDWGIDTYVGRLDGVVRVWQSKFFREWRGEDQRGQVRMSFQQVVEKARTEGFTVDAWTLCVPCVLPPAEQRWWDEWSTRQHREHGVRMELWNGTELRRQLCQPEACALTRSYFPVGTGGNGPARGRARSGYVEQIRQIAPADGLDGRGEELAELAAFCNGDESYVWWTGDAWTGKTALMSTFALRPPPGVDVVSFFVTSRLSSQSDGSAFIDALLNQLSALVGESLPPVASPQARDAHVRRLLHEAAARAHACGRRLVLLVDGLDEDKGFHPGAALPSIASLLPKVPEPAIRVIVSSRPDPPLPDDLPGDHPLRRCHRRQLAGSPHAAEIARLARVELSQLPLGDFVLRDTVGLITASGGGLTLADLEQLTGAAPFELDRLLSGTFGRTIPRRESDGGPVYLFAHETLLVEATRQFGATLVGHRDRIDRWADTYAAREWPPDTPAFLVRGYPRMLRDRRDVSRLCALVLDPARQNRLLAVTGGDAAAFTEIAMAQDLLVSADAPDLATLALVALRRDRLAARNAHLPVTLPAVWVAIGQNARAESLARGMADVGDQAEALAAMAKDYARAGQVQLGLAVVATIDNDALRVRGYVGMLRALDDDRPDDLVHAVADAAGAVLCRISDEIVRDSLTGRLAVELARAQDVDRALAVLDGVEFLTTWACRAADIVEIVARAGQTERTAALVVAMEDFVAGIPDEDYRQQTRVALARAAALTGDIAKAVRVAVDIADTALRVKALSQAAGAAAARGDRTSAGSLAQEVQAVVRAVPGEPAADLLRPLADAFAHAGDFDAAQAAARAIGDDHERDDALSALAVRLAAAGRIDTAEAVVRDIGSVYRRRRCRPALVALVAYSGDHAPARRIAESAADPAERAAALAALAHVLAHAGETAEAAATAVVVERTARAVVEPAQLAEELIDLANALIDAKCAEGARRVARAANKVLPPDTISVLRLMVIVANLADYEWAAALARSVSEPGIRSHLLAVLAQVLTVAGEDALAEALLAEMSDGPTRVRALTLMAGVMADQDRRNRADHLLDEAERIAAAQADHASRFWAFHAMAAACGTFDDAHRAATAIAHAQTVIDDLDGPDARARAAAALARSAWEAGGREHAEALYRTTERHLAEVRDPDVLRELVTTLAALGRYDQAEAVAARIDHVSPQSFALTAAARIAAEAGQLDLAERLAAGIVQLDERVRALAAVVRAVGTADPERADRLTAKAQRAARENVWVEESSEALCMLVDALIVAGRPERARQVADGIEVAGIRARALLSLADAAHPEQARRLIAEAIVAGRWTTPLDALARVEPAALMTVADGLLAHLEATTRL